MYPRQTIPYSPYPPSNQAYSAVYFAQPAQIYPYNNYPGKMGPISYAHDNTTMMTTTANPPPVTAQIPPQPDNLYINYQQPQQQILSQQSLPQQQISQQQLSQQQLPQQHILQQQQQRQYELSHQIGQLPQAPVVKPRPMPEQYIGPPIKNKPKPIYQPPISPQIPKQMIQQTPQRTQPMMIPQQPITQPPPRQYNQIPQKPQIIQQPIETYKFKQDDSSSLSHKTSFAIQDNEPPGCFDIIGRGNLPSIFFNTSVSFS